MGHVVVVRQFNWPWIVFKNLLQVVHKSWVEHHCCIDFVFMHIIYQCPISHSNIIIYEYCFHISLIHCWIEIQILRSSSKHFYGSKTTLAMKNFLCPPCLFFIPHNLRRFVSILYLSFSNVLFTMWVVNIYVSRSLTFYYLTQWLFISTFIANISLLISN